jgi:TolB-like protein
VSQDRRERTIPGRLIVLPMLVFAGAVISIAAYWLFSQPRSRPAPPPSIAVLPFDSADKQLGEREALGVMEKLAGIPGFEVLPRDDAFPAKGADVKVIGERLNVRSILEGSIQQSGDRFQVTARLINTSDAFQFWSKTFDATDLSTINQEVAKSVMETLDLKR